MANRKKSESYVQLCHKYNDNKHFVNGWMASTKLDGMRAWWDGGVSRGKMARDVPWANVVKDGRFIDEVIATGLWSRTGKVIRAPQWWLDCLPEVFLDGELYLGPRRFQELVSKTKDHYGDWNGVQYRVFDSPPIGEILRDRIIEIRFGKELYRVDLKNCVEWVGKRESVKEGTGFQYVYAWLKSLGIENNVVVVHNQETLPYGTEQLNKRLSELFEAALKEGNEGLVLRNRVQGWKAERSYNCLKYKPMEDAEGVVVGYYWGRETDFGSRLLGKMGALVVEWQGKTFKIGTGFSDTDRKMNVEMVERPGEKVSGEYWNRTLPLGTVVTFLYRELSDDGIPKEARFLRKREGE